MNSAPDYPKKARQATPSASDLSDLDSALQPRWLCGSSWAACVA
jgi:hypothetical protein